MENSISVLIVDDNVELCRALREYLGRCKDLEVMDVAEDGLEALDLIKEHMPDVVILDLIMPNLDGIGVLERFPELQLGYRPVFIVLTAVGQESIVQKSIQMGADYYMLKPFDAEMLVKRIRQINEERNALREVGCGMEETQTAITQECKDNKLELVVTGLIRDLKILPNAAGFHYLREAVILSVEDPTLLVSATKYLYPAVADRHNTTADRVSRAIRITIENSAKKFTAARFGKKAPSNIEIIAVLAERARLRMEKG